MKVLIGVIVYGAFFWWAFSKVYDIQEEARALRRKDARNRRNRRR